VLLIWAMATLTDMMATSKKMTKRKTATPAQGNHTL